MDPHDVESPIFVLELDPESVNMPPEILYAKERSIELFAKQVKERLYGAGGLSR